MTNRLKLAVLGVAIVVGLGVLNTSNTKTTYTELTTVTPPTTTISNGLSVSKSKVSNVEMTDTNSVRLEGVVDAISVPLTINSLEKLRKGGATKVFLLINSPGGSVLDGVKLTSYIESAPFEIDTVCIGLCASMAAHIHQVGKHRLMTPKSILMFHPASGGLQGNMEQMNNQLQMFRRYMDRLDAAIALRSKQDFGKFKERLSQEYWIETEDALSEHFADGVVNLLGQAPVPVMFFDRRNKTEVIRKYEIFN